MRVDQSQGLEIIYRDPHYIAINKPAGLLVHRSAIDRHETRFALQLLRDQIGQRVYPLHRLDKPTSGLLLFGLSKSAARHLSEAFARRLVCKRYLAVVRGYTQPDGIIDYPLTAICIQEPRDPMRAKAVPARTTYRALGHVELPFAVGRYPSSRYSLLEIRPYSGRRRQIRRHMKHIFHPIIGDVKYGEGRHNRFFRTTFDCHRLLLSAMQLSFRHPYTEQQIDLTARLDATFTDIIRHLGWIDAIPPTWVWQCQ